MAEEKVKKGNWWTNRPLRKKISFILGVVLFIITVMLIVVFMDLRRYAGNEVADQIYGVGISTGWALLWAEMVSRSIAFLTSIIVVFFALVLIFICNFITHLFDRGTRKTKTIASLIRSLSKYVIIIVAICVILVVWGVDVAGVLAGVGVITLIIGLGCQSLIQDVVSGIFIVFDDYFTVGETVIIDGFRGTVTDVGLKTTKLQDVGGNIKSITNSSINTVVNMSRIRSIARVTISVSYNEDIERVEALILKEIEAMKEKIPNIIEGPYYKGIDSIGASSVNFLVICFTDEGNRFQVTRDMTREFFIMCQRNDIVVPYEQITINPEDKKDRQKASAEEIKAAVEHQKVLRGIKTDKDKEQKDKKQNKVVKTIKESYKKTKKEMEQS